MFDQPIFDAEDWRLSDFEAQLCSETRNLGLTKFADRAASIDKEARFPSENYEDIKLCVFVITSCALTHPPNDYLLQSYSLRKCLRDATSS